MIMTESTGIDRHTGGVYGPEDMASLVVDDVGTVIGWSDAAENLLGYSGRQVLGRSAKDLLIAEVPGDGKGFDVVLRHRDGHPVGCRVSVRPEPGGRTAMSWKVNLWPSKDEEAEALDRALLEALFTCSPVLLYAVDPQLRLLRYNPVGEGMQGTRPGDGLGKRPNEMWPNLSSEDNERILAQVLATGKPVVNYEKVGRPPSEPDRDHFYSASAFRLETPEGRVLGVGSIAIDITKQRNAQQRLALVAEAGSRIGTTLSVMHTARELADVVVPRFADGVVVDLLEFVLTGEEVPDDPGATGWTLRRAASRFDRIDDSPSADEIGEVSFYSDTAPAAQVLIDHKPRLVPVARENDAFDPHDPAGAGLGPREPVHSLMVVPLLVRDRALGVVSFHRRTDRDAFEEEDLGLAQDLATRAAVALDNARLYVRERNTVVALQHGMLSREPHHAQTVQAAHQQVHSGAGGDWTDVIPLPGARVALVAGSTPGRGMHTAATMGRLRTGVQTLAALDLAPDEIMARLDDLVRQMEAEATGPKADSPVGTTCLYLVYDPVSCECTMAAAGLPGLAVAGPEAVTLPEFPAGPPLGRPGPPFAKFTMPLPGRNRLVLFTPGLLQAFTGEAGRTELVRLLSASDNSPHELSLILAKELVPPDPTHDAAVLVAHTQPFGTANVATWVLPPDPAAVATARSLTTRQLTNWSMDDEMFSTELIVSELVTNAIRYAKPPIQLRLIHDRTLSVEVSDGSSTAPHLRHARTTDEGGRGLLLVSQFAQRWGARYEDQGKTIWAEEPVTAEL